MGRSGPAGSVDATLPVAEGVEGVRAGSKASQYASPQFSHGGNGGQECLTCASQMSGGENSGALALLGLAGSVTGNARLRGMRDMSLVESRIGADANLALGHRNYREYMSQGKGRVDWR